MSLVGTVEVAGKRITFGEMSTAAEWHLGTLHRKLYAELEGDAYRRCKPMLDGMDPKHVPFAVAEITRAAVSGELPGTEAREMARCHPRGVALELYMRAKKHHPDLTLKECELMVNEVNCYDVLSEIIRQLTPEDKDGSKS